MSVTKSSLLSEIETALDNAISNTGALSDTEQATAMQVITDYVYDHCDTVNPNVKSTPHIKFKASSV